MSLTPPAPQRPTETAMAMTVALNDLIRAVAGATMAARTLLATCPRCRNHLSYLMDTEPYSGQSATMFSRRIAALGDQHAHFHGSGDTDTRMPEIRGFR